MGTICILFGIAIFLASLYAGICVSSSVYVLLGNSLKGIITSETGLYLLCVGVFGFIGLLICLNLVMHGKTYNKVQKIYKELRNR